MSRSAAEIVREYGPFPDVERVHGVSYDGRYVWFAAGDRMHALDPASGEIVRSIDVAAQAGTAFDGRHLFQLAGAASRRSIRRPAAWGRRFRRPAAAVRALRGPKGPSGAGRFGTGRF